MSASPLKERLQRRELLVGTWVKTPSAVICEVLARTPLDLLALDAEHAPFGRGDLDACLAITRALGCATLVRVPSADPAQIMNALDCGAAGVIVPHIITAAEAEAAVRACHYGPGGRGYAGSTRSAGFAGRSIETQMSTAAASTVTVLQIEDAEALSQIEAIAAVRSIDALFVGRVDLTVSLGCTQLDDPRVVSAVERICSAATAHGVPVGMFVSDPSEAKRWRDHGASLFILGSDHGFLLAGARALVDAVR
jgi:2-keto-3-deoxy-L-rhamnonate aldolase RhmA